MESETADRIGRRIKNISIEVRRFVEKKIELFALTAGEHYSELLSKLIQKGAGLFMLAVAFIFLLVALAIFIGDLLDSLALGYVIVSVPLVIIGISLYKLKPQGFNRKLQNEIDDDVVRLLERYEEKTNQELRTMQIEETLKEKEKNG